MMNHWMTQYLHVATMLMPMLGKEVVMANKRWLMYGYGYGKIGI